MTPKTKVDGEATEDLILQSWLVSSMEKKLNQLCEGYYLKLSLSRGQRSTNDSSVTAVLGVANATITKWFCTLHSVNFQITPNYSNYYCLESVEK